MKTLRLRKPRARRQHGVALVIILAMVVLLTVVVLAYFSRTLLSRQVSNSSANETKAEFLAKSALDVVVSDLKQEIANGSTATTNGKTVIYAPATYTNMVPQRSGVPTGTNWPIPNLIRRSVASDPIVAPGVASRASAISSTNTSQNGRYISLARWNSHYLMPRFNAPTNSATVPPSTPDSTLNFVPPDWVLVTRAGPSVQTAIGTGATALNNPSPTNQNYVIGRYAYAVYTEGGLLDVNAAGFPSGLSAAQIGQKGTVALADLTKLPIVKTPSGASSDYLTQTQVDQIVGWRNYYTAQPSGAFGSFTFGGTAAAGWLTNVQGSTNGFLKVSSGATSGGRTDQAFLSRQELIKIASAVGLSPNVLQYLGTFSREYNAPSWSPTANAKTLGASGNDGVDISNGNAIPNAYAYKDNADSTTAINRRIYGVPVRGVFPRRDGSTSVVGEPLVKTRFDLNKLSWITHTGVPPTGVTAADILNYFGLTWQKVNASDPNSCWVYNHGAPGNGTRIMTLDEVATANREPDFFELLQAGILQGSLGLVIGDPANATDVNKGGEYNRAKVTPPNNKAGFIVRGEGTTPPFTPVYAQEKYQIIQIGANIIDQADADSFPTEISLNKQSFYGVENLPYFNTISQTALRPPEGGAISPNQYQAWVHQWLTFSLWNPHQTASIVPSGTGAPTNFRVYSNFGVEYPMLHGLGSTSVPPVVRDFSTQLSGNTEVGAWVSFKIDDFPGRFAEPTTLDYNHTQVSEPNGHVKTALGWSRAGIYMGASYSPDITGKVAACSGAPDQPTYTTPIYNAANIVFSIPMALDLQYQDPATNAWRTYAQINGLVVRDGRGDPYYEFGDPAWNGVTTAIPAGGGKLADNDQEGYTFAFLDPRAVRLNLPGRRSTTANPAYPAFSCENYNAETGMDGNGAAGHFPVNPAVVKNYVNNVTTGGASYYTDRDFVRRMGDSAGWLPAAGTDPLIIGNTTARPVILNRPFRNVGELGYVFRDDPWKSLNLFSASSISGTTVVSTSADAALLDIFCIGPSATNTIVSSPAVVAGKVDLNTASAPVLTALMAGAVRDYTMANPLSANTTLSLSDSQAIASDIVAKIKAAPFASIAELPGVFPQQDTTISGTKYPGNAEQREAMIRGVADSAGTRTWNLMIDLVAQSGKYGPAATSLNDFIVEGERRYWLHIAIDRFTGQIIDQQLELVTE